MPSSMSSLASKWFDWRNSSGSNVRSVGFTIEKEKHLRVSFIESGTLEGHAGAEWKVDCYFFVIQHTGLSLVILILKDTWLLWIIVSQGINLNIGVSWEIYGTNWMSYKFHIMYFISVYNHLKVFECDGVCDGF